MPCSNIEHGFFGIFDRFLKLLCANETIGCCLLILTIADVFFTALTGDLKGEENRNDATFINPRDMNVMR